MKSDWAQSNFRELKTNGRSHTAIISPENMALVANDPDCAQRLTYIHFDWTNLEAPEFSQVQKLPNIKTISFYDCEGVPTLLGYAAKMPSVEVIHFDYERPYDALIKGLASIPNLKTLLFNNLDIAELDVFRRALPNVRVDHYDKVKDRDPAFDLPADTESAKGVQLPSQPSPK